MPIHPESRLSDDPEMIRTRDRLHKLEGKMYVVETLVTEFIKQKEHSDATFKWFVGVALIAGQVGLGALIALTGGH